MKRVIRMLALTGSAAAVLGVLPATASAAFVSPTAIDFGNVPVGTTSAPQQVLLSADCTSVPTSPCATALLGDFVNVALHWGHCEATLRTPWPHEGHLMRAIAPTL